MASETLESVLSNLVENALRHGGAVEIGASRMGDWIGVEVFDDGPGISEANLPKIFDRFFTTRRDEGGSGLGLAIVRALVEAHGGRIEVRSKPGETVFSVWLPAVQSPDLAKSSESM